MIYFIRYNFFLLIFTFLFSSGCQSAARLIQEKSRSTKSDIFVEINKDSDFSEGYAVLYLQLSFKTSEPDKSLAPGDDRATNPDYSILLNIDGQTVSWEAVGQPEDTTDSTIESGKGVKYKLSRKIKLKSGLHKIFFALPANEYTIEFDVSLSGSKEQTLNFVPRYNYKSSKWRKESFLAGFKGFDVYLDDKKIVWQSNARDYSLSRSGRRTPR
jgi:hypothetical protein